MKKLFVVGAGSAIAATAAMATVLFGAGVAAADDYAGQTYADASSAAGDAGLSVKVAARVGDKLPEDECLVTRSQTAPFASANDGLHRSGEVQFYLNCAGAYASATKPGASVASPEGREAKAAADAEAAKAEAEAQAAADTSEEQAIIDTSTPDR
ncbi:hypothetical protein BTO20_30440 [Mycobacterium dioxanotrophicus]|uniref:PASTA domain-containing protein n=1 Tax=Mycobacterium dioxanotrophicus TaxID=482462 RepID=A0A1Y0CAL9_9MYCO|nr:hypothetical protein [Mycobacterium dioxanotrophicus]ART72298.1 hypothetical protein BTO20_30440 [Mycobacterium dioxanotrophicus]